MRSRHISRVMTAAPAEVCAQARDPRSLPLWASGLARARVRTDPDDPRILLMDSPMGEVRVRFAPSNPFGVLDHTVTLPTGETVQNPLRVLDHPEGSEVVFTVRQLDLTEEEFDRDCATVAADLERLQRLVEGV